VPRFSRDVGGLGIQALQHAVVRLLLAARLAAQRACTAARHLGLGVAAGWLDSWLHRLTIRHQFDTGRRQIDICKPVTLTASYQKGRTGSLRRQRTREMMACTVGTTTPTPIMSETGAEIHQDRLLKSSLPARPARRPMNP
jgi:hypothetical protein